MATYRARPVGAGRIARNMSTAAAMVQQDTHDEQVAFGETAELIYAAHALHKSGRLMRGIVAKDLGGVVQVEAHARNPLSGYEYVGVTRFGHKVAKIVPKKNRGAAVILATKTRRGRGRAAALRLPFNGGIFRRSAKAFHPSGDWADRALPQVRAEADKAAQRLGRKVASRI